MSKMSQGCGRADGQGTPIGEVGVVIHEGASGDDEGPGFVLGIDGSSARPRVTIKSAVRDRERIIGGSQVLDSASWSTSSSSWGSTLISGERAVADRQRATGIEQDGATGMVVGSTAGGAGHAVAPGQDQVGQGDLSVGGDLEHSGETTTADGRGFAGHTRDGHVMAQQQLALGQDDGALDGRGQLDGVAVLSLGDGIA